ncbi:hypothetical protein EDD18DRAFT_1462333 [Armillaria luteobubalina]|uniref:Uncharacterized protein n=1 Tax=Armillaria luteobubalina TaxID=153913 RepID=A0AA39Q9D2_9AGAR|nr:hypothetical protein EDD18DRAFT_1462333 [Armillaria luteobubalina]
MSSDAPMPVANMPSVGMTMGGLLAGLSFTAMLYGISIPQLVIYYRQYPTDPRLFRYSIVLLWILDTLHLALISSALYSYLVTSHGNYQAMLNIAWSLRSQNTVSRIIVVGIQAHRDSFFCNGGFRHRDRHYNVLLPAQRKRINSRIQYDQNHWNVNATRNNVWVDDKCVFITCSLLNHRMARFSYLPGIRHDDIKTWGLYMNSLLAMLNYRKIPLELAMNLGHPISIPSSGAGLEFAPDESRETAI